MVSASDKNHPLLFSQKCALAREILGEDKLLREACPDLTGDRSRIDLVLYKNKLGVRGPRKTSEWDFELHEDLNETLADKWLHPQLLKNISEIRENLPPLELASIRIRSGMNAEKGLWIESSNELLAALLLDKKWLESYLENDWIIELGQNRFDKAQPLSPQQWLSSVSNQNETLPIYSRVKNFSQPGFEANRAMIFAGMELCIEEHIEGISWAELGSGCGNLTAAYSTLWGAPKWIVESDHNVTSGLDINALKYFPSTLRLLGHAENLSSFDKVDLILADPPRSGFSSFFNQAKIQPRYILLYSCDMRGLLKDKEALAGRYRVKKWSLVDCFPDTHFAELVSLWEII